MAATKLTEAMRGVVRSLKAAGKSNNAIAKALKEQFGTGVDRRNIDRYVAKIDPNAGPPAPRSLGKAVKTTGKATALPKDELAALEKLRAKLWTLIHSGTSTASEVAKLSAEYRAVQAQIREAKTWSEAPAADTKRVAADAEAVIEKLKQLEAAPAPVPEPAPVPTPADSDVEPVPGSAACG